MENNITASGKKISIRQLIKELKIQVAYMPEDESIDYMLETTDINRPGIQLAGFFEHFSYERLQVIGKVEYTYFSNLEPKTRLERLEKLMSYEIPALVITRGLEVKEDALEMAKKYNRIVLKTDMATTRFISKVSDYLNEKLAPSVTIHGVLVDVDGIGIMITGESGVGKSETALELVKRGHRLVADDAVEIKKIEDDLLFGEAPAIIRHLMEIRGIGILDIKSLYGVGAVKPSKIIDMVIHLENWKDDKYYDRLGLDEEVMNILEVPIEKITIPVKPGRNLAVIIEIAARNFRQKKMGYNAAREFNDKLMKKLGKER